jgi:hypothetical protein
MLDGYVQSGVMFGLDMNGFGILGVWEFGSLGVSSIIEMDFVEYGNL